MNIEKDSKYLSLLLRHHPEKIGLNIDNCGWVLISELQEKSSNLFTMEYLEKIVSTDKKKRYSFNKDKTKIRANQGHSIPINPDLVEKEPPYYLYHGTAEKFKESILKEGIKKMKRQYVHLSADKDTAWEVGKRHGEPIIFVLNTKKMYEDGIKFYQSQNKVWLTDYIDPKYLSVIYNNKIILYSKWCFIPDELFLNKMKEFGYDSYDDEKLRLDTRMIEFIERNTTHFVGPPMYLAEKANTFGKAGIAPTVAWIDYVDTTIPWTIVNGDYPFVGAEKIEYYKITHKTNNRFDLKRIF